MAGPHFLVAGCWERGVDLFQEGEGGVQFLRNEKKSLSLLFSVCVVCVCVCVCICVCVCLGGGVTKNQYIGGLP